MSTTPEKSASPAYCSYKSLTTFFNARREDGHITDVVDRSLMNNFSGSTINELLATLKFIKMTNDKGVPSETYKAYVLADDAKRKGLLADIVKDSYGFIFGDATFNIERATSDQVAQRFRNQGVNGSTLTKAITFFLTAAKEAGIKVSANIKAPPPTRNATSKPKKEKETVPAAVIGAEKPKDDVLQGEVLDIPIPINRKVRLILPDFKDNDWTTFTAMLTTYVAAWKAEKAQPGNEKDKEPVPVKG